MLRADFESFLRGLAISAFLGLEICHSFVDSGFELSLPILHFLLPFLRNALFRHIALRRRN